MPVHILHMSAIITNNFSLICSPQDHEGIMLILFHRSRYGEGPSALVMISAFCKVFEMWITWSLPSSTRSLTKLKSSTMCFIFVLYVELVVKCIAPILSQQTIMGRSTIIPSSDKTNDNQSSFAAVKVMLLNFASMLELVTVDCLWLDQKIRVSPR